MTKRTLHSFSTWLRAEIAELNSPDARPNSPDVCDGAAAVVREARRIAQSLGYPDLVPRCTVDQLAVSTARDTLSRALATIDPPAFRVPSGPLTVKQAAERLAVSPKTIYAMIDKGRLRCQRIGRAIRINPSDLDRLNDTDSAALAPRYKHLRL